MPHAAIEQIYSGVAQAALGQTPYDTSQADIEQVRPSAAQAA
jgi:hypothetical protein